MKVIISLGNYTANPKNGIEIHTKYSNWAEYDFKTIEEAETFAQGVVCGLQYKWVRAACTIRFEDGHEESFI